MLSAVPSVLTDLATIAGVFVAVSAATAIVWRTPPMRWFRAAISHTFGCWVRDQVQEALESSRHAELTRFHLGPNGSTPALWSRVEAIEYHVGIRPPKPPPRMMLGYSGLDDDDEFDIDNDSRDED